VVTVLNLYFHQCALRMSCLQLARAAGYLCRDGAHPSRVACVGCKTMYWAPVRPLDPAPPRPADGMKAIGGPQPDSGAAVKRDAADAAKDYRKPGRSRRSSS